jgi:general secretion pathway protein C
MQNIKYHILNTASVVFFSFILALTINQFIRLSFITVPTSPSKKQKVHSVQRGSRSFDDYKVLLDSGFFKLANPNAAPGVDGTASVSSAVSDLQLLGTISGPSSIARALIKKRNEKDAEVFNLWQTVYGFKLVRIDNAKVYLKGADRVEVLDMFAELEQKGQSKNAPPASGQEGKIKQSISRAELQQKVLGDMDNALKGLTAGPHRVDGKVEGYKLFRIAPSNMLYKLGARSGDVVKRVNGHPIDSTEKLYKMWQSIQGESRITIDLERGGKLVSYDFSITE